MIENEEATGFDFQFLLNQLYRCHKKDIYSLQGEVNKLTNELTNLRGELNEAKNDRSNPLPIILRKDVGTQVDADDLNKLFKLATNQVESVEGIQGELKTASPAKVFIVPETVEETVPSLFSKFSDGSKKFTVPEKVRVTRIQHWLEDTSKLVILAPETEQCIPETMMPDTNNYEVQIIPETVMPDYFMQKTSPPKILKGIKTTNSNQTINPSTINNNNEGNSKMTVSNIQDKRKTSPRSTRLSRKKEHSQTLPLPKTPTKNHLPNVPSNHSPNIFSSPDVNIEIKKEIPESFDPDETMLPEEFAHKQNKVIKLENAIQPPDNKPSSQELLKILAKFSPRKKLPENLPLRDSFDIVEQRKENYKDGPVRKKSERQKLNGYDCQDCANYFVAMNLNEQEKQKRLKLCSRHRATHPPPPATPEFFWECGFPSTPECKARGYEKETQKVVEFKHRRKRPLKMINNDQKT